MPGNLYGVSQPGFTPVAAGGGDVACANDVDTVIITTSNILAKSAGFYFVRIEGPLVFLCGAVPPPSMFVRARVQGQAAFFSLAIAPGVLLANATFYVPSIFGSNPSGTAFYPTGSIIEIVANPATNPVTFKGTGSGVFVSLFHGPDL